MKLTDIYKSKKTVLSFEIFPPKKDDELENIDPTLEILSDLKPDYISVTFGAGGHANNSKTIALAKRIKEVYHTEPVVHLTGLCYDKEEIDLFAKEIQNAGVENILALRGDINPNVPAKDAFPHASDLIAYLKDSYDFCIAGACYPEIHPESKDRVEEMKNLKKKVDAGAEVLLSQLFFSNKTFYEFTEICRIAGMDVPITPGIMPALNAAQINRMVTMCGATLPHSFQKIIERFGNNKDALFDAGMSYALSQIIDLLANDVDGIHLYTMNNPVVAKKICEGVKNIVNA
ncbi:MAG: methylenetetrahydrofolate reductase [Lachnospiraceae bacterium]|nr:methylenetetrahydrofolate reductase [NAD(P)H] [Lachnospiraceae bacterium]MBR4412926.1 methylenetetrahydrofolate reductase [NAD(P)H] [Lachnospiraceae bacterium]MBR5066428.1 methylenetetrahydrofolate reductase [NAD(P)H] [Lachnospiraceae bacterium]MBR5917604.1 methylenetetrahydrofolate reductase [NAD(P)H] [Lachnospiraceae bacterium]MBR6383820.1 methylenetetrahydrofolate reductase [NAD(P)H] [Lachnospiraceae bacterium]